MLKLYPVLCNSTAASRGLVHHQPWGLKSPWSAKCLPAIQV